MVTELLESELAFYVDQNRDLPWLLASHCTTRTGWDGVTYLFSRKNGFGKKADSN